MIGSLPTVSLADVRAAVPLLDRVEHKYVVPLGALGEIVERLGLPVLEIDGRRTFRYASVYFDTVDWATYRAAAHRRPGRCKVRTRSYLDTATCALELKARSGRGRTVKQRLDYDPADAAVLTAEGVAFLTGRVPALVASGLRAALTTRYGRWSFADVDRGVRVTIDTDVAFDDPAGRGGGLPDHAIVETKSTTGASAADRLLWEDGHRPEPVSKYALGVAALHPALPHNRWHRALARYVRLTEPSGR